MNTLGFRYLVWSSALIVMALGCSQSPLRQDKNKAMVDLNGNQIQKDKNADAAVNAETEKTDSPEDEAQKNDGTQTNQSSSSDLYKKFNQARLAHQNRSAQEAAGELLARNPGDPKVLNGLATLAIEEDKYNLARLLITKILEKNPTNASALNNLGVVELKTGTLRLALADFKKATEADSSNKFAHANLGTVYLQYRNYQNAAQELQAAFDHGDQSTATLSNLGFALTGVGKYEEAETAYNKALAKEPSNATVMLNCAALLIEHTGKIEKGVKLLNKIRFVAHEPAILEKAEILAKMAENLNKSSPEKESPIEKPIQ